MAVNSQSTSNFSLHFLILQYKMVLYLILVQDLQSQHLQDRALSDCPAPWCSWRSPYPRVGGQDGCWWPSLWYSSGLADSAEKQFTARQYFQERLVCSALDWFCSLMTNIFLLLCLLSLFLSFLSMFVQALFLSFKLINHFLYHSMALACQH